MDYKPLVCEDGQLSVGRIAFWIMYIIRMYHMLLNPQLDMAGANELLYALLGYNLMKKWSPKNVTCPPTTS